MSQHVSNTFQTRLTRFRTVSQLCLKLFKNKENQTRLTTFQMCQNCLNKRFRTHLKQIQIIAHNSEHVSTNTIEHVTTNTNMSASLRLCVSAVCHA